MKVLKKLEDAGSLKAQKDTAALKAEEQKKLGGTRLARRSTLSRGLTRTKHFFQDEGARAFGSRSSTGRSQLQCVDPGRLARKAWIPAFQPQATTVAAAGEVAAAEAVVSSTAYLSSKDAPMLLGGETADEDSGESSSAAPAASGALTGRAAGAVGLRQPTRLAPQAAGGDQSIHLSIPPFGYESSNGVSPTRWRQPREQGECTSSAAPRGNAASMGARSRRARFESFAPQAVEYFEDDSVLGTAELQPDLFAEETLPSPQAQHPAPMLSPEATRPAKLPWTEARRPPPKPTGKSLTTDFADEQTATDPRWQQPAQPAPHVDQQALDRALVGAA